MHTLTCTECTDHFASAVLLPVEEEFMHKRASSCASLAPTADPPHIVVLGEPVGRGADVPDEGRDRHDGRARPRAEERTERALRARGNGTFVSCP